METNTLIYTLIFILLVFLELLYFRVADRFNIIDKPNERSSHKEVTLRGGGIVFLFAVWLYAIFFGVNYWGFIVGVTLVALISFIDDVRSLPDSIRLVVQFIAMAIIFYEFNILNWANWWIVLIAAIVCVGTTNAYNFMDGINGITGAYSLSVIIPLLYINSYDKFIDQRLLIVTILALLVFNFFNFRKKAKCFAGDVGSLSMAFIVVFALGKLIFHTGDVTYIMFLALYGVDAVLTIFHRIMLHENLGQAHRKHIYQLMANELKIPHLAVSSLYAILQLIISFGLILLPINHWLYSMVILLLFSFLYIVFKKKYYHLHVEYLKSKK